VGVERPTDLGPVEVAGDVLGDVEDGVEVGVRAVREHLLDPARRGVAGAQLLGSVRVRQAVHHVQAARVRHPVTPSSFVEENFRDADSSVR
jgi:hypothetical protein